MNRYKVHAIVERIRRASEFPFNIEDVDECPELVLGFYGINEELDPDDSELVRRELRAMAEAEECMEAARVAARDPLEEFLGRA